MEQEKFLIKLLISVLFVVCSTISTVFTHLLYLFTDSTLIPVVLNIISAVILGYCLRILHDYLIYDNDFLIYLRRTDSIYTDIVKQLNYNPSPFMFHWIYEKFKSDYDKKLLYNELRKVHNSSTIRIIPRNTDTRIPYVFLEVSLDELFSSPSKYIKYYESTN